MAVVAMMVVRCGVEVVRHIFNALEGASVITDAVEGCQMKGSRQ
jgi:hypothetical protein